MYNILEGIKILDLTNVLAGPFCTYQLSMLGAEVIKIEKPFTGDLARKLGVDEKLNEIKMGTSFLAQNANKKSVVLDLKDKKDLDVFYRLAEDADVIVENFRPGVVKKLGADYGNVKKFNSKIIYCSISGFGQNGELSERPAYDQIIQGMAGVMSLNGNEELNPLRCGFPVCDTVGGITAAMAIIAALFRKEKSGKGTYIDVSMFDSILPVLGWAVSNYLIGGEMVKPMGNDNFTAAPSGTFNTKNGLINISANEDKQWQNLCYALDRMDLTDNEKFRDKKKRKSNREELNKIINGELSAKETSYWVEKLCALSVPCGEVLNLQEVFNLSHVKERKIVLDTGMKLFGKKVKVVGPGAKFPEIDCSIISPAPKLGEHTELFLKEYRDQKQ
ncbi:MAG TPA: CoA transferase [Flexistipes sinusarabici]|uniref:CoA transferase n=1 Tax=Flexistipes sinusarabici TaxID=2352 RepID=A0A3D5Q9W9_FLESI|nr:CoA transferase [Flexistipes sinusarabici]